MIDCNNLKFSYAQQNIFSELDINFPPEQLSSIVGPNGVGKSTLVKCLCNIYSVKQGVVYVEGEEISKIDSQQLAKKLGYVPQKQKTAFSMTVYELILLGRKPYINWRVTAEDEKIVETILDKLDIINLAERKINTLSGGERQKVVIARVLAQEPSIIFFDEPTSNLDLKHQLEVMELLSDLAGREEATVVVVMHDLNLASKFSDNVFLLGREGIYAQGNPEEVFTPENIKEVYGVEVEIINDSLGRHIILV